MKRFLTLAALSGLLLTTCPTDVQAHYTTHNACKDQQERGDWLAFAYCMGEALDAPGGGAKTRAVVECESSGNRFAGKGTTFRGLTQQHKDYYQSRVRTYVPLHVTPASWIYSGRWNLVVGIKMAKEDGTWAYDWPYCGR